MNLHKIALAAWLALTPFAVPTLALADAGQGAATGSAMITTQPANPCPQPGDNKLNIAQTGPGDCCKDHKGVCGCRAGKIVCCDRTISTQPGCTCHGDDGFLQ